MMSPDEAIAGNMDFLIDAGLGNRVGVGVSGGSDSLAALVLVADWARAKGWTVHAATVDHGLRPEARAEAESVAAFCAQRGIDHDILVWGEWDGTGNLQAAARDARKALLGQWAGRLGLARVVLGHTTDDQAETFLMRLARGSGVDGLACMAVDDPPLFLRPLLEIRRDELRALLDARGIVWVDDPTNDDPAFDRVKARQMMAHLSELGLTTDRLVRTAAHMARARVSLDAAATEFAARHIAEDNGDLIIDAEGLQAGRGDTATRVFASALNWIGGHGYRPRYAALVAAMEAVRGGASRTLGGVLVTAHSGGARLSRELSAVQGPVSAAPDASEILWDGRWRIVPPQPADQNPRPHSGPHSGPSSGLASGPRTGFSVRALGDDIALCKDWRAAGRPRASVMASPAVYVDDVLVAAPLAGKPSGWTARIVADFTTFLLSH